MPPEKKQVRYRTEYVRHRSRTGKAMVVSVVVILVVLVGFFVLLLNL